MNASQLTMDTFQSENIQLKKAIYNMSEELVACKSKITKLQSSIKELTSVPVYDVGNKEVGRIQRKPSDVVEANNKKRKRLPEETDEHQREVVRVKLENTKDRANKAEEQLDDLETKTVCMYCMENTVKILCLPCNHLVTCQVCIKKVKDGKCIKCRQNVESTIEVGFP